MRIPRIRDLDTAVQMYYECIELHNDDIQKLFISDKTSRPISRCKVNELKKLARERMGEENTLVWNALAVNTKAAYKAWGLDIDDLEERMVKLRRLNMHSSGEAKAI